MPCRRHVVTYNDTTLDWKKCDGILPVVFDEKQIKYIRIHTGRIPEGAECMLRLGINNYNENTEVFVNSVKASFVEIAECEYPVLTDSKLYCYKIPFEAIQSYVQIAEIIAENMTVDYVDLVSITKK